MSNSYKRIFLLILLSAIAASGVYANSRSAKRVKKPRLPMEIKVSPVGLSQATIDSMRTFVENSEAVQKELRGTKYRLLEFTILYDDKKPSAESATGYRAFFYDYTNDRNLVAEGGFDKKSAITVRPDSYQPVPNEEEFEEALSILKADSRLGPSLKNRDLEAYRAMPPITVLSGTMERLVNVGLNAKSNGAKNEIVSVSIRRGEVVRYDKGAPDFSNATPEACGIPQSNQGTTPRSTAGQYNLTVSVGPTLLWEMTVIRPSVSSGTRGSGIELRDVKFKGKSVFKRAHTPVLNVKYDGDFCGPYRDWQWQEDYFQTPASGNTDPAPGIRILPAGQIATTALDSGNDTGNHRGVAIYTQNNDAVLVTEMQAGWYRYIAEWRFDINGTIRPRFGFGATDDPCVCEIHHHHVYWRFDFDVVNPNNKIFQINRGRKFLTPVKTEMTALRSNQFNRGLLIQNSTGDEAYALYPNISDGAADAYGKSDFWALRYKNVVGGNSFQNELDDGYNQVGGSGTAINIDQFINGESLVDQDVVVWYGGHFDHEDAANVINPDRSGLIITGDHVVGPDIRPVRW